MFKTISNYSVDTSGQSISLWLGQWLTRLGLTLVATAILVAILGSFNEAWAQESTSVETKTYNVLILGEKKLTLSQVSKNLGDLIPSSGDLGIKINLTYENFDKIEQLDAQIFDAVLIATNEKISETVQTKITTFESKLKEGSKVITVRMSSKMQDYALKGLRIMVGAGILSTVLNGNHSLWGMGIGVWLAYYGSGWLLGISPIGILKNVVVQIAEIKNSKLGQKISIAGVSLVNALKSGFQGLVNFKDRLRNNRRNLDGVSALCSASLL